MHETRHQVTQRKIRNGLRKQKAKVDIQHQTEIWDALKGEHTKWQELDAGYFYCPYIPIMSSMNKKHLAEIQKAHHVPAGSLG